MLAKPICLLAAAALLIPVLAFGRGTGHAGAHVGSSVSHSTRTSGTAHRAQGVARDKHGRIARSQRAKNEFKQSHPCPSTGQSRGACPGYVIDHVTPLKRGGADKPGNMQWQTKQAAKEKDKTE